MVRLLRLLGDILAAIGVVGRNIRRMENRLMATLRENLDAILTKQQETQETLDEVQAFVQGRDVAQDAQIAALTTENERLQAIIDAGGEITAEELQRVVDRQNVILADMRTTMETGLPAEPAEPGTPGAVEV